MGDRSEGMRPLPHFRSRFSHNPTVSWDHLDDASVF